MGFPNSSLFLIFFLIKKIIIITPLFTYSFKAIIKISYSIAEKIFYNFNEHYYFVLDWVSILFFSKQNQ